MTAMKNDTYQDMIRDFVSAATDRVEEQQLSTSHPQMEHVGHEFAVTTAAIREAVVLGKARLLNIVEMEIRRAFEAALGYDRGPSLDPEGNGPEGGRHPSARKEERTEGPGEPLPRPEEATHLLDSWARASEPRQQEEGPVASTRRHIAYAIIPQAKQDPEQAAESIESPFSSARPIAVMDLPLHQPSDEAEPSHDLALTPEDEVYEGNVKLNVGARGCNRQLVDFVNEMYQRNQFRLLRLVGNRYKEGADIWLELREPLPLERLLRQMRGVARVTAFSTPGSEDGDRQIAVELASSKERVA